MASIQAVTFVSIANVSTASFDKLPRPPQSSHRSASIGSEPCEVDQVSMLDAFLRFAHVPCSEFELRLGPWLTRMLLTCCPVLPPVSLLFGILESWRAEMCGRALRMAASLRV